MLYSVRKAQLGIRRSGTVVEGRQVGKADQRGQSLIDKYHLAAVACLFWPDIP